MKHNRMVRPDAKGRITLGKLAQGVSRFEVFTSKNNRIILKPYVEISADEQWLFNNKIALNQVRQGLKEAAEGKLSSKGSFAHYINEDDEE